MHHPGDLLTPSPGCPIQPQRPCSGGHSLHRPGRTTARLSGGSRLSQTRFPGLIALQRLEWPPGDALTLPPRLLQEAEDIRRVELRPGAPADKDRGEVATALMAQHLGNALVVMEDEFGKRICARRNVPRMSTAQLAAELVAAGALDAEAGLGVYDLATPEHVGRPEFESTVEAARLELAKSAT